jgi:hypothetical protein
LVLAAVTTALFANADQSQAELDVLSNGQTIRGFRGPANSMWLGRLLIPTGVKQLVITTSDGQGDCDLYLRSERGANQHWDFRSQSGNTHERIIVLRPRAGWWQVGLLASGNYSGVTLHVVFDEPARRRHIPKPVPPVQTRRPHEPDKKHQHNPHAKCDCGCKGDRGEHERRHRHRRTVRLVRDEFEPNSKRDMAMQIFESRPQLHTINPDGDEDWNLFVPQRAGRYVLELTDVTTDLEGELYAQAGRHGEKRVDKFEIRRGRSAAISLDALHGIAYFKIKIEAEDGDDVGSYRLNVKLVRASRHAQPNIIRPDVYESDDRAERPTGIKANDTQLRTIYPRDDEDWLLFAPTTPGEYLLKIGNVTTKLKGELWVKRDDDKERRVDKFEVSRWGKTIGLHADRRVEYFKIRIRAQDDDDTGDYRVSVLPSRLYTHPRRERPNLRFPPVFRSPDTSDDRGYRRGRSYEYRGGDARPTGRTRIDLGGLIGILLN